MFQMFNYATVDMSDLTTKIKIESAIFVIVEISGNGLVLMVAQIVVST